MEQMTLFENSMPQPLAARLRPQSLEEYVGQAHLLGPGKVLRRLIESDQVSSMIFGAARRWKNDVSQDYRKPHKGGFYRFFGGNERDQGNPYRDAAGGG